MHLTKNFKYFTATANDNYQWLQSTSSSTGKTLGEGKIAIPHIR